MWTTRITIINFRTSPVTIPISFTSDSGQSVGLPIGGHSVSSLTANLPPFGRIVYETDYLPNSAESVGVGRLNIPCDTVNECGNVGGFAVFKSHVAGRTDQEAVVPVASSTEQQVFVSFDNRDGYDTGIALTSPKFVFSGRASVTINARDNSGNRLLLDQIQIATDGHVAFMLAKEYPQLAGQQGTIEFSSTAYVSAIALMFNPTGAFTTCPSFAVSGNL